MGKRVIPLSKEKAKRNLLLQELQEKRKASTRELFRKASESEEAGQENPTLCNFSLTSDSEVSFHYFTL